MGGNLHLPKTVGSITRACFGNRTKWIWITPKYEYPVYWGTPVYRGTPVYLRNIKGLEPCLHNHIRNILESQGISMESMVIPRAVGCLDELF